MRFIINPIKSLFCILATCVFFFLFVISVQCKRPVTIILYSLLTLVYIGLTLHFTTLLEVDEKGVRNRFLLWTYNSIPWSEIHEVGIANMKVMKNAERKKAGELYLYFSREAMTEKERFGMCLNWPPKEKRYMRYSVRRLKKIQKFWEEKPVFAWISEEAYLDRYFKR